jgi:hypothetical protein
MMLRVTCCSMVSLLLDNPGDEHAGIIHIFPPNKLAGKSAGFGCDSRDCSFDPESPRDCGGQEMDLFHHIRLPVSDSVCSGRVFIMVPASAGRDTSKNREV